MARLLNAVILVALAAPAGFAQAPAQPTARPQPPTRDPHTPGYVDAKELPDGAVPSANVDGNFILGPTHNPAPEMTVSEDVPQGTVYNFTMESADSKIYPGIARDRTFGRPTRRPAKLIVTTSHPAPTRARSRCMSRSSTCPARLRRSSSARTARPALFTALDNLIAEKQGAGDDRDLHRQRRRRRAGQRARPGIRHHVRPATPSSSRRKCCRWWRSNTT